MDVEEWFSLPMWLISPLKIKTMIFGAAVRSGSGGSGVLSAGFYFFSFFFFSFWLLIGGKRRLRFKGEGIEKRRS